MLLHHVPILSHRVEIVKKVNEYRLGSISIGSYNPGVVEHRHLPDADDLSVLSAIILLAYVIARFVDFHSTNITIQLPGLYLNFEISIRTVITLLVTGLAASGAEWLMRQHPRLREQKNI